jgi:regulator of protease activity HflC (stomatin/prohibitin superfamily)
MFFMQILRGNTRGVVFQLGRCVGVKGPGLVFLIPFIQQMVRVDLNPVTLELLSEEITSRDNERIKVDVVVTYRILDPQKALSEVADYRHATRALAQVTLRNVLGRHTVNEIDGERERVGSEVLRSLAPDVATSDIGAWGIMVTEVKIRQVDLGVSMGKKNVTPATANRM